MAMDVELPFFQDIETTAKDALKAVEVTNEIAAVIKGIVNEHGNGCSKQTVLNMAFRTYYKLLYEHNLPDIHFDTFIEKFATAKTVSDFEMLYAILLSERGKRINLNLINEKCLKALVPNDGTCTLLILKNLNLLQRKDSSLGADITLAQIYIFLQSNEFGMREEALTFFNHSCRPVERARRYFQFIVEYYPWTNRNKYYMLSCILNTHTLDELLEFVSHDPKDFFGGLRLSLSYKHLLPASQYLVKALSKQDSKHLLDMAANILANGMLKEVENFYAQWYSRIVQKDVLFCMLQEKMEVNKELPNLLTELTTSSHFLYIFLMNSRRIMSSSKLLFFKITTEFLTECFRFEIWAQLLIYKFVAENMNFFALEDCLEFLFTFIKHHRNIENAQMRNNILGKIPTIINYISKTFFKMQKRTEGRLTTLDSSVKVFFSQLHKIMLDDIQNKIYQPKIFALKLLDILLRSLYQQNLEKNAKNCDLAQNQKLGALLISHHIFNATQMTEQLLEALYDPQCYNDALDLIVDLLPRLRCVESQCMIDICQKCCQSVDIDECALGSYYAKVSLKAICNEKSGTILYKYAMEMLRNETRLFHEDPLFSCKERNHLFGYLEVLNVILSTLEAAEQEINNLSYSEVLDILEDIQSIVLKLLNSSVMCDEQVFAASFQDMDKSLEMLVEQSKYKAQNHEECRKFLLMSFWLTLKACCDVATTLGCNFASKYQILKTKTEDHLKFEETATVEVNSVQNDSFIKDLHRCLNLNVFVLTRCRHKGAIEAAGLSIGKLTKHLTTHKNQQSTEINELLWNCLLLLFNNDKSVSTTRRGAGYSIMFLHVIKNDCQPGRPLLKRAMAQIFQILDGKSPSSTTQKSNCDRIEALTLHYLCVLVKDSEIRNAIYLYYNDIMLAAIAKIDDPEWTVCNAALQLFGALVPKIVGQRQATEFEELSYWEPTQVTYSEIFLIMPKTFEYILNYCKEQANKSSSTRSIILFLGFLSKIEHLPQDIQENEEILLRIRELMWSLLQHQCEKIRKLAAACYVRAHDFRCQLPHTLLCISDLLFQVRNENFFVGLLFVICEGIAKMQNEALHTIALNELDQFYKSFRENIVKNAKFENKFKLYTQSKFLDMLKVVGLSKESSLIRELINYVNSNAGGTIGYDEWCKNIEPLIENASL